MNFLKILKKSRISQNVPEWPNFEVKFRPNKKRYFKNSTENKYLKNSTDEIDIFLSILISFLSILISFLSILISFLSILISFLSILIFFYQYWYLFYQYWYFFINTKSIRGCTLEFLIEYAPTITWSLFGISIERM